LNATRDSSNAAPPRSETHAGTCAPLIIFDSVLHFVLDTLLSHP
jgi:hypothetical protein